MAALMRSSLLRLAIAVVRAWTRVYTWRLPLALREDRRAEIESDLWESQQDTATGTGSIRPAAQMLIRLLAGIPDDLRWRMDQAGGEGARPHRGIALSASAFGALLFAGALLAVDADAARERSAFPLSPPTNAIEPATLTPLTAGIVATVGASMMPRLAVQLVPSRASGPAFEAASIKPNRSGSRMLGIAPQPGGRFTATNMSLGQLIRNAYQLPMFRMSGGPDWIESDRFDVVARAGYDAPQAYVRLMLQTLLEERFKLTVHTEAREQPIYELIMARRDGRLGPHLRRSDFDCAGADWPNSVSVAPRCGFIGPDPDMAISSGRSRFAIRGTTMDGLARFLPAAVRRYVSNRTGLDGHFDGEFDFTVEIGPPPSPPGTPDPYDRADFQSIFTVVQEQLGLKLEPGRGPVDVLVIDSAQQPTRD